mgnify:CR=1 FL=1
MYKNKIIILLAAFNGEHYIREQLKTVFKQTFKPCKIFINIDLSSDNTISIVQDYAKKNPEIHILNTNKKDTKTSCF